MIQRAKRLLRDYDLGAVSSIGRLRAGHIADKYMVNASEKQYLLRIRPRGFSRYNVSCDHKFQMFLAARGLPVPRPIPDRQGNTVGEIDNRCFELLEYLPHDATLEQTGYENQVLNLAEFLGEFHGVAKDFGMIITGKPEYVGSVPLTLEAKYFLAPLCRGADHLKRSGGGNAVDRLARELQSLQGRLIEKLVDTPRLVCHSDFYGSNILVSGGQISGLVDFDFCMSTSHMIDIVEGLHGAVLEWIPETVDFLGLPADGSVNLVRGREFLRRYEKQSGLSVSAEVIEDFLAAKLISLTFYPGFLPELLPPEIKERVRRTRGAVGFLGENAGWAE